MYVSNFNAHVLLFKNQHFLFGWLCILSLALFYMYVGDLLLDVQLCVVEQQ